MRGRSRGFTLIELLIAMALFVILSTALIALLTRSLDFLTAGSADAEVTDRGIDFVGPFQADVENLLVSRAIAPGAPEIRLYADFLPLDVNRDGAVESLAQRFAFVRSTRSELVDRVTRPGGAKVGAEAFLDGRNDFDEANAGALRATGGMMEVMYVAVPDDPSDPGVLTLYRLTRSPIGGRGSLLDPATVRTAEDVRRLGQPYLTGVLHFGVEFSAPSGRGGGFEVHRTWDSTRGILPKGSGLTEFAMAAGPESLADPRDDVSPRSLVVTVVTDLATPEERAPGLDQPISATGPSISVVDTGFAAALDPPFLKVGTEWVRYGSRTRGEFTSVKRGERGTIALSHDAGTPVRAGATLVRTIRIPAFREEFHVAR